MSFWEDFSRQYLPVLALRLNCCQQSKYLYRKAFGCLQKHLLMNAWYCRSLLYSIQNTSFLFSRYKSMLKANFQNTQWLCAHKISLFIQQALLNQLYYSLVTLQACFSEPTKPHRPQSCVIYYASVPKAVGLDAGAAFILHASGCRIWAIICTSVNLN